MENTTNVIETYHTYFGNTGFGMLFFCCIIFCFIKLDDNKKKAIVLLLSFSILLIYNNYVREIIAKFIDVSTYYRFLWLLPVIPVCSYVIVQISSLVKKKWHLGAILILIVFALLLNGTFGLTRDNFKLPSNIYNVNDDTMQIAYIIEQNKDSEQPIVVFDLTLQLQIRSYDASIIWAIDRPIYIYFSRIGYYQNTGLFLDEEVLLRVVNAGSQENREDLIRAMDNLNVDFIVVPTVFSENANLGQAKCEVVGRSDNYTVFHYSG